MNTVNNTNQPERWNDFNTADSQHYEVIPAGTIVAVCMTIQPGGFDDLSKGWDGGYATKNRNTGSIYLNCEFIVLGGQFDKRKIWQMIGLHSEKGIEWQNMGRSFIRGILNSSNGLSDKDTSLDAQKKRRIAHLRELDKRCFVGKLGVKKDSNGNDKNEIKSVLSSDHKDYQHYAACFLQQPTMNNTAPGLTPAVVSTTQPISQSQPPVAQPASQPQTPAGDTPSNPSGFPSWAE